MGGTESCANAPGIDNLISILTINNRCVNKVIRCQEIGDVNAANFSPRKRGLLITKYVVK